MFGTRTMLNSEVILLETFDPTCNLTLGLPETQKPAEGCMVSPEQELPAIQIDMKVFNSFDYC